MFAHCPPFRQLLGLLLLVLTSLLLSSCKAPVDSQSPPIAQSFAWLMDDTGQASLADIQNRSEWQNFDGSENWGFGKAPVWVRYTLRAASPEETGPWIVRIQPSFLEDLTLHDPAAKLELRSGLLFTKGDEPFNSLNFNFEVPALKTERHVYLKIQTDRSRILVTTVLPLRAAIAQNQTRERILGFLISISAVFAMLASIQWVMNRELVMGAFALKQWMATFWALSIMGFSRAFFADSDWLNQVNAASVFIRIWMVAASLFFYLVLIKDYKPSATWIKVSMAVIASLIGLPLLQFFNLSVEMGALSNVLSVTALMVTWLTLMSSSGHQQSALPRSFLVVYFLLHGVLNVIPPLVYLDWIPFIPQTLSIGMNHIILDGFVMFLLLQFRARNLMAQKQQMAEQNQLIAVKLNLAEQSFALEQRRRTEQSQFLHMLMHELKTPLTVVSLALGTQNNREENLAHAGRAVQDMKAIIDRCILADQTGEASLTQHKQAIGLESWLHQMTTTLPQLAGRMKLFVPGHLPEVETDEQLLRIIVVNLLSNASHYSDPLTPVTVSLAAESHQHRHGVGIRVSNTPGLAGWPDPELLFTKYYRASGAQRESGSGLGLFLSRQLAQHLGGSLIYKPSQQQVEFVLWIPLRSA
jgi:two-component system, sensor histidine kinase LadS